MSGVRLHLPGNAGNVLFRPSAQAGALDEATGRWTYLSSTEIDSGLLDENPHFREKGAELRIFAAEAVSLPSCPNTELTTDSPVDYRRPRTYWAMAALKLR